MKLMLMSKPRFGKILQGWHPCSHHPICWMLMLISTLMLMLQGLMLLLMMMQECERMAACVPVAMARAGSASTLCY